MSICKLADSREIFYRESGTGPVLVLLHGWSMSSAVFLEVLPQLAKSHRVLAVDLPGHGASELDDIDYSLDTLAGNVEAWLQQLGLNRCALLGWSLGGQVALQMHLRRRVGKIAFQQGVSDDPGQRLIGMQRFRAPAKNNGVPCFQA